MGRLSNILNTNFTNSGKTNTINSGSTNIDVHIFVDEDGNVTQIKKYSKPRLKYYIDPNYPDSPEEEYCVIGVSDPEDGDCSYGDALGVGDKLMAYAIYDQI